MFKTLKYVFKELFTTDQGTPSFAKVVGTGGFFLTIVMVVFLVPLAVILGPQFGLVVPPLVEWSTYFTGASVLIAAAYAGLTGLIWGTDKTENKGTE